ncbi:MAG: ribonuclease HII [Chlorobi bacterium]|nr:ribonuclease HII [Chlorobiota bacterium]
MAATELEHPFWSCGQLVAGVDEAGRGCLAGPVVVAAVVLNPNHHELCRAIEDSKQLSPTIREQLYSAITQSALAWSVSIADVAVIEERNILGATMWAMAQAVESLRCPVVHVLVDGPKVPPALQRMASAVIGGDRRSASIGAASIIAKVTRDRIMLDFAAVYPQYGFQRHKGYPTAEHFHALDKWGPTAIHRRVFLRKWRERSARRERLL